MGIRWTRTPTQAFDPAVAIYVEAIRTAIRQLAERWAVTLEAEMKSSAPWQDQTANARQTLSAAVEETAMDMVSIILAHGVEYGYYLEGYDPAGRETMQGGRFAIVMPTIDANAPRIWQDVVDMLR